MTKFKNWQPQGIIPAVLLPFKPDFSIEAIAAAGLTREPQAALAAEEAAAFAGR